MKKFLILLTIPLLLAACTAAPAASEPTSGEPVVSQQSTPLPAGSAVLATDFEDATSVRNQLALGILKLEGTDQAVTAEQAKTLLPLWQGIVALTGNSMAVPEELDAIQNQIVNAMTPEQLEAIDQMQITNAVMNDFYAEKGIVMPSLEPGVTRDPGAMRSLPEADREATRAARIASGTGGQGMGQSARTVLFEEVIDLLEEWAVE